jgi:hypothetical protein
MSNEQLPRGVNGSLITEKINSHRGSAISPSISGVDQPDTGMYWGDIGFNGFGMVSGGDTKIFIDDETVAIYNPLTIKDSVVIGTSLTVLHSGKLYKKYDDNALYWNTTDGEVNITNNSIGFPLSATNGTALLPSYSFDTALDTGIYMSDVGTLGITVAGVHRAHVTADAFCLDDGVDLLLNCTNAAVRLDASAVVSNYTLLLPSNAGTLDQVITGNGGGVLTWTGPYLPLAGATMSGNINIGGFNITNGNTYTAGNTSMAGNAISAVGDLTLNSTTNQVLLSADPTELLGVATKQYVDNIATGLSIKSGVRVKTVDLLPSHTPTGSKVGKTLTMNAVGILTIDAVAIILSDRILVDDTGTTTGADRGIYEMTTEGTAGVAAILTRATDTDQDDDVTPGMFMFINEGATRADTGWVLITNSPIILDDTSLSFTQFSSSAADHATLSNLNVGDPHTQYVKIAGDTMSGVLLEANGAASAPSYAFSADTDTGIFLPVVGSLGVAVAGAETWRFDSAGGLSNSGVVANARSVVDITSTTKGFLPPRMTKTQRDSIAVVGGDAGMMIYNTSDDVSQIWNGTTWITTGASLITNNTVYVSENGVDVKGARNDLNFPFLTLEAAVAASLSGDTIIVYPGAYFPVSGLFKEGVNWYFHSGAVITNSIVEVAHLINITGGSIGGNVYGHADFVNVAVGPTKAIYNKGRNTNQVFECNSVTGGTFLVLSIDSPNTIMRVSILSHIHSGTVNAINSMTFGCNLLITCPIIESVRSTTIECSGTSTRSAKTVVTCVRLYNTTDVVGQFALNAIGVIDKTVIKASIISNIYVGGTSVLNITQVEQMRVQGDVTFNGHCDILEYNSYNFNGGIIDKLVFQGTSQYGSIRTTVGTTMDTWDINPTNTTHIELTMSLKYTDAKIFNISTAAAEVKIGGYWETPLFIFNISAGSMEIFDKYHSTTETSTPFILTGSGKLIVSGRIEMNSPCPAISIEPYANLVFNGGNLTTAFTNIRPIKLLSSAQYVEVLSGGLSTNYIAGNLCDSHIMSVPYFIIDNASVSITIDTISYLSNLGTAADNATALALAIPNATDLGSGAFRIDGTLIAPIYVVDSINANVNMYETYTIGDALAVSVVVLTVTYSSNSGTAAYNATNLAAASPNIRDLGAGVFTVDNLTNVDTFAYGTELTSNITTGGIVTNGSFGIINTFGGPVVQNGTFRLGTNGYGFPLSNGTVGQVLQLQASGDLDWVTHPLLPIYIKTNAYFENTGLTPLTISEMTITPPDAGTYKVNFNTQFNTTLASINAQALTDLNTLYTHLIALPLAGGTISTFATGSIISPGVYTTAAAISPTGSVTFDAANDPDAIFVIRSSAGALSIAASCAFSLINGATASMIYWVIFGAITIGASASVHGTYVGNGAVTVGLNCNVNGRVTTRAGAITNSGNIQVSSAVDPSIMGLIEKFALYTSNGAVSNAATIVIVGDIGTFSGAISGFGTATISGNIYETAQGSSLVYISLYIDDVIQPISTRERTNSITREDIVINDILTITTGQTISVKCLNNVGISRFYNRILLLEKI